MFGGFGGATTQQQQPSSNPFGGGTTGTTGLFGGQAAQQQPQQGASLFGNTPNQQTGTTSLFGGGNQQQQQQEQKPGLFGNLGAGQPTAGTTSFTGFGGTQNTQQQGGTSLFGNQGQQQQKPSLFGGSTTQQNAFGQSNAATGGGSLFNLGGAGQPQQQQQQPTGGFGSSLLNQSQQPQQQQPTGLQASLLDGNPYGSQSIFSGLPPPNAPSPGPLATPLSATIRQKQRTPLPVYKISPNAANRLITPPTRQGYGFSYSTYGTPSSSSGTPNGLNSSLLGGSLRSGSLGRSFSKSMSTSNLRKTFDADTDSILSPGAFSAGNSRYSSASLKRLTIDRSLRTDLFSRSTQSPSLTNGDDAQGSSKLKKKVSFDSQTAGGDSGTEIDGTVARVEPDSPEPTAEELGFLRSSRKQHFEVNGTNGVGKEVNGVNGVAGDVPEMEQVRGNELAVVPEGREQDGTAVSPSSEAFAKTPAGDPKPGEYWMKPTRSELSRLPREQQKHFVGFTVGRAGCGSVTFDEPVDLTTVDIDSLFDKFIKIGTRSITVYPDDVTKPPRGKGLNVPSTLRIENSWPRGRDKKALSPMTSGPAFERHVDRLKRVTNTEFIDYEKLTGTWVFKVPHFTTYGLDYEDDDDDEEGENFDQSTLSAPPPDTPTPNAQTQTPTQSSFAHSELNSTISLDESFMDDSTTGMEDDTFEFKKRKLVPGAFLGQGGNDGRMEEQAMDTDEEEQEQESFLDDRSSASRSETGSLEQTNSEDGTESEGEFEDDKEMDVTMVGSFPPPIHSIEQTIHSSPFKHTTTFQRPAQQHGTPSQAHLNLGGNWAEQLQRTISPRKQNRQALREIQGNVFADKNDEDGGSTPTKSTKPTREAASFATSIDLMNSLFPQANTSGGQGRLHGKDAKAKGFQV